MTGLEHVPRSGRAIVVANHPAGIVDGIAVYDGLRSVREDLVFLANGDAIRVAEGLTDMLIPVEWRTELRTHGQARRVAKLMAMAFRQHRLVVIYPSGRIAHLTPRGLKERPWQATAISLARRYDCPIVPLNIRARNSWLFYLFAMLNTELRDMTLFRELFNKRGQSYELTVGHPIRESEGELLDLASLQHYVEHDLQAGRGSDAWFNHLRPRSVKQSARRTGRQSEQCPSLKEARCTE